MKRDLSHASVMEMTTRSRLNYRVTLLHDGLKTTPSTISDQSQEMRGSTDLHPKPFCGCRVNLDEVQKAFVDARGQSHLAVRPISLAFQAGSFNCIIGPSGCGKSTLLRMIAGLDVPTSGLITSASPGQRTGAPGGPSTRLSFVFQDAHLLPWRTSIGNVEVPLELAGVARSERRDRAFEALRSVGLADAARRYPRELSGGMRMRVSLARALVNEPELLLLDEPFAALDEITRQTLDESLRSLWASRGITVIFVTHSIAEATYLGERVIVLSPRPARVVLDRIVELPAERPAHIRSTPAFAHETGEAYNALARGDA
jgi:NitT/TauT family transport system ATP-binding protein